MCLACDMIELEALQEEPSKLEKAAELRSGEPAPELEAGQSQLDQQAQPHSEDARERG
jgi:hypothetical protein